MSTNPEKPWLGHTTDGIQLSGKPETPPNLAEVTGSWATRKHPDQHALAEDEARSLASYTADRASLAPFLIPHRFESNSDTVGGKPSSFALRKRLGYAPALNRAYLAEILGQIRAAPVSYKWGKLGAGAETTGTTEPPENTVAKQMWHDATRRGHTWRNFFEGKVLERMLSSVGGFVLVDVPPIPVESQGEEGRKGKRPYFSFIPWSGIEDWGMGEDGVRWMKIAESDDDRDPKDQQDKGFQKLHLLYQLDEGGTITIGRYNDKGEIQGAERTLDPIVGTEGRNMLPLVPVGFGEHPRFSYAGAGLLMGLADIVLDLYNLRSERRSEFRDIAFSFLKHKGSKGEEVRQEIERGQRFVDLGTEEGADIDVVAASGTGIEAGKALYEEALNDWALAARRKAADATERSTARSGISLQAEFELDLKPLLVEIVEELDSIETNCMFIAAQLAGDTAPEADALSVSRATDFRLENEDSRISRIVKEARDARLPVAGEALVRLGRRWNDAIGLDRDEEIVVEGGGKARLGDVLDRQVREIADADQNRQTREGEFTFGAGLPPIDLGDAA